MQLLLLLIFHALSIGYCAKLSRFNLYHTDYLLNSDDRHCLYYFTPERNFAYQFIQYCIRFPLDAEVLYGLDYNNSFTFEDLRKKNITSQELYEWSAPIDLIEHYQDYVENNVSTKKLWFYNCSYPWFGSRCEYHFDEPQADFDVQVEMILT